MSEKVEKLAEDIKSLSPEGQAAVGAVLDAAIAQDPRHDIFAWANNLMSDREDYMLQLFYLNKNGVVYSLNNTQPIKDKLRVLFLDGIMELVLDMAGSGGVVRKYEETVKGDNSIAWIALDKVSKAANAVYWLQEHATEIDRFSEQDHSLKRQVGIFAVFTKKGAPTFQIFKAFDPGKAAIGDHDFVMTGDKVEQLRADAAFKIDASSQVLVIEKDVFVFNQSKFEKLFGMKPHQVAVANKNGAYIDEHFKLTMPLIVPEIAIMAQQNSTAMKRLAEVDPTAMTQDEVAEVIDAFEVGLMIDDDGRIIIESPGDVIRFLDVLSDNYVQGQHGHYLAKNKKLVQTED